MEWISVKDAPLIYTSPTGAQYPTAAGKRNFFAAIPCTDMHTKEPFWMTMYVTLDDECNIRDVDYDEDDPDSYYTVEAHEITHYFPEPEPPKTI